jgi:hypothetical protein
MDGGDGLLSLTFPYTSVGHTTMVIIDLIITVIVPTPIVAVGIVGKMEVF